MYICMYVCMYVCKMRSQYGEKIFIMKSELHKTFPNYASYIKSMG